ncbi:hypothetical protein GBA52_008271 [Prunus armeniaca]|nr:hypothetical protein GBA52_008271 [Prunus armeniaca]
MPYLNLESPLPLLKITEASFFSFVSGDRRKRKKKKEEEERGIQPCPDINHELSLARSNFTSVHSQELIRAINLFPKEDINIIDNHMKLC